MDGKLQRNPGHPVRAINKSRYDMGKISLALIRTRNVIYKRS